MFCKHEWSVLVDETIKPAALTLAEEINKDSDVKKFNLGNASMTIKAIHILTCVKCGKLQRFVTEV